jgi:hypothetical protein
MPPLTDDQLDTLERLAWPLSPKDLTSFIEAMIARLGERPEPIGPGYIGRLAREVQREFSTPPLDFGMATVPSDLVKQRTSPRDSKFVALLRPIAMVRRVTRLGRW